MAVFSESCHCIISGASQGLGREIAVQFAREWNGTGSKSDMVLIARNLTGLEETKRLVLSENKAIHVSLLQADLCNLETLSSTCDKTMEGFDPNKHKHVFLLHNAGILGDITKPIYQQQDPVPLTDMMTLHVTSMWLMTAKAISSAKGIASIFVLNISSLLASVPVAGLASYSATRAARNMFMQTLCLENTDKFRAFTYSPGACDTGMLDLVKSQICFEESKTSFAGMKILKCADSIIKLMRIIKDDTFENGAVIDYYDYNP